MSFLRTIFRPNVTNGREVSRYVASVTVWALACVLAIDVPQQLWFFGGWMTCLREWALDFVMVFAGAIPVARSIGRSQLELFYAKREADRLGRTDSLTGLANRRAFYEAADRFLGGAVALAIADIDRFKRINDSYGHAAGDEVIRLVGMMLSEELSDLGTVARVGGEEFALLCGAASTDVLRERLERVRSRLAVTPAMIDGAPVYATLSFGLAIRALANFSELYAIADKALYLAKASGRDRIVEYELAMDLAAQSEALLLRRA